MDLMFKKWCQVPPARLTTEQVTHPRDLTAVNGLPCLRRNDRIPQQHIKIYIFSMAMTGIRAFDNFRTEIF